MSGTPRRMSRTIGRPERRPLTRVELQAFLDAADDRVESAALSGRKGWLAAFRDATLFKTVYGWGLPRREAVVLDVCDFTVNPAAARSWAGSGPARCGSARRCGAARPAAVLADCLNLSPGTAVRWMHQAGADWNRYAAGIARSRDHQP